MINVFEEAFKQNAALDSMADTKNLSKSSKAKKTVTEAAVADAPRIDLSNKPKSITNILQTHRSEINDTDSLRTLIDNVIAWFEEIGLDTPATKEVIRNLYRQKNVQSAQYYLYNVILKGSGLGVESVKSVPLNKIKFTEDIDSIQPEEDIMVVYTDTIEDDMSEEDVAAAAQELVGQEICKCGICGANYVCSCKDETEELLVSDEDDFVEIELGESLIFTEDAEDAEEIEETEDASECPVCGANENQIVVGEIVPLEEVPEVEIPVEEVDEVEEPAAEDETTNAEAEELVDETGVPAEDVEDEVAEDDDYVEVDERLLNRLFTKFAKENFENVKSVKFNSGKLLGGEVVLEGVVTTTSDKTRDIKLISNGFKMSESTKIVKVFEQGPFTESASVKEDRVPFVLECSISNRRINFTGLKYNYNLRESSKLYSVYGKVNLSEKHK